MGTVSYRAFANIIGKEKGEVAIRQAKIAMFEISHQKSRVVARGPLSYGAWRRH